MSSQMPNSDDFWPLLNSACDDGLVDTETEELATLLDSDSTVRKVFLRHVQLRTEIQLLCRAEKACDGGLARVQATLPRTSQPSPAPALGFFDNTSHNMVGYFSSGWPVAYLVATVVLGIGLLIGSLMPTSRPQSIADQSPLPGRAVADSKIDMVGQITGMIDCQWETQGLGMRNWGLEGQRSKVQGSRRIQSLIPNIQSLVSFGDTFALASGLMEITYNTGAKVVLQGPCIYVVESRAGGFLSAGKLTARVEKGGERRGERGEGKRQDREASQSTEYAVRSTSESAEVQFPLRTPYSVLPAAPSPLFAIRTPTATVTDLGTEFGVEVDNQGGTTSYVFCGTIELRTVASDGKANTDATILHAHESARVEKRPNGAEMTVSRDTNDGTAFVRVEQLAKLIEKQNFTPWQRWQAYSLRLRKDPSLLAYYLFESANGNLSVLPNLSAAGSALDGQVENAEWVSGRLPGKFSLYFRGPGSGSRIVLPEQERFNFQGAFSIAVWFKVERLNACWQRLICKGDMTWVFQRNIAGNDLGFFTHSLADKEERYHEVTGRTNVADGRWHLGVVVYDPAGNTANMRLYMDGCLTGETTVPAPLNRDDNPVYIGSISKEEYDRTFCGWIDEVAILTRALSPNEVAEMFDAGKPAGPLEGKSDKNR